MTANDQDKIEWSGTIVSIQPRTTVWRYKLENRTHYHRGYELFFDGEVNSLRRIAALNLALTLIER